MDAFLKERLDKYDKWLEKGDISYPSKVVPVQQSISLKQHVMASEKVMEIIKTEDAFAVTDCICRKEYQRCDKPLRVCLLLNATADRQIKNGTADRITLDDVQAILQKADQHGLVHLTFYEPGERLYALCSCCSCCCHDMQLMKQTGRTDIIAHSRFVAVTQSDICAACGLCIDRCVFEARSLEDDLLKTETERCYGCGLCLKACPENAIALKEKETPGK